MTSTTYQVTGMTREHCVRAVTDEVGSLDGVTAVAVDLVPCGTSAVTVTSDSRLSMQSLAAALDEAGDYRLADGHALAGDGLPVGAGLSGAEQAGPENVSAARGVAAPSSVQALPLV
jgi:copper chaperone CopZ